LDPPTVEISGAREGPEAAQRAPLGAHARHPPPVRRRRRPDVRSLAVIGPIHPGARFEQPEIGRIVRFVQSSARLDRRDVRGSAVRGFRRGLGADTPLGPRGSRGAALGSSPLAPAGALFRRAARHDPRATDTGASNRRKDDRSDEERWEKSSERTDEKRPSGFEPTARCYRRTPSPRAT